jgi:hypothetical protein
MKTVTLLLALLLIPTFAAAQDATEAAEPDAAEPEPVMCLSSTSLDDGNETLTNVHVESQLLLGQRGSVKVAVTYETKIADASCKQLTLTLPADGAPGTATIKVGAATTLVVEGASVVTNANGQLVLTGDSLSTTVEETPVS